MKIKTDAQKIFNFAKIFKKSNNKQFLIGAILTQIKKKFYNLLILLILIVT